MKKSLENMILTIALACSASIVSCNKPEAEVPDSLELTGIEQECAFAALTPTPVTFTLTANNSWAIQTSGLEWVEIEPMYGSAGEQITVTIKTTDNNSEQRDGSMTVVAGSLSRKIDIMQQGTAGEASIFLLGLGAKGQMSFAADDNQTQSFLVLSNRKWELTATDMDWASVSPLKGAANQKVTINVTPIAHNLGAKRTGTITITAEGGERSIPVIQQLYEIDADQQVDDPKGLFDYSIIRTAEHPRLLMSNDDFETLMSKINSTEGNTELKAMHQRMIAYCDILLRQVPTDILEYKLDVSDKRLLSMSELALRRCLYGAYCYRTTGDKKYLDMVEQTINTVASFPDWNWNKHYLDMGPMSLAVAVGYDWCFDDLSVETRHNAVTAMKNFAIWSGLNVWSGNLYSNWNQVCNCGLIAAALAVYEKDVVNAAKLIDKCVESNRRAMREIYSPDGNYPEGAGYWAWGCQYQVLLIDALFHVFGTDSGLELTQGFRQSGEFFLFMGALGGKRFNYADSDERQSGGNVAMWWYASHYNQPSYLVDDMRFFQGTVAGSLGVGMGNAAFLMKYANKIDFDQVSNKIDKKLWMGRGIEPIVMIHTDWTYSDTDKYVGIKAGTASSSHNHMDVGSFIYDAYGVRWARDLGSQGYTSVETLFANMGGSLWAYGQTSLRWTLYRLGYSSHNTISVNGMAPIANGVGTILNSIETDHELGARMNLSAVYAPQLSSAYRTIKLVDEKVLMIVDEIKALNDKEAVIRWNMATYGNPEICDGYIKLTSAGKTMYLKVNAPSDVTFYAHDAVGAHDYDQSNAGTYMVGFTTTVAAATSATITVSLTPEL